MSLETTINIKEEELPIQMLIRAFQSINHRIRKGADVTVIWERDSILVFGKRFELRAWYDNSSLKIVWEKRDYDNEYRIESKFKKVVVEISQDRAKKVIEYIHDLVISMIYASPSNQDIYLFIRDLIKPLIYP